MKEKVVLFFAKRQVRKGNPDLSFEQVRKKANLALLFGSIGIISVAIGLPLVFTPIGAILLGIAGVSAVLGDIFAISARRNLNRFQKEEDYKKLKNRANWGLALALLTGLIPLGLFIAIIIALN